MKNNTMTLAIMFLLSINTSCQNSASTTNDSRLKTDTIHSINVHSDEFDIFYLEFFQDSVFQFNHLRFPIEGGISYCDSVQTFTKTNWIFINEGFMKAGLSSDSTIIDQVGDQVDIKKIRPEIGVLNELKFRKIEGVWYLVYFFTNAC